MCHLVLECVMSVTAEYLSDSPDTNPAVCTLTAVKGWGGSINYRRIPGVNAVLDVTAGYLSDSPDTNPAVCALTAVKGWGGSINYRRIPSVNAVLDG
ncbi:hypothetical protein J6590_045287 [Homalodisca vitripennis]|nr:hypothetical protein J6590_045287 [Homalodisca vitripennis]